MKILEVQTKTDTEKLVAFEKNFEQLTERLRYFWKFIIYTYAHKSWLVAPFY